MKTIQSPCAFCQLLKICTFNLKFFLKLQFLIQDFKHFELTDLSLLILKIKILWGLACHILGWDKWRKGTNWKILKCLGFWREIFIICPCIVRTPPFLHFTILTQNINFDLINESGNSTKLCFWARLKSFLHFWTSPLVYFWDKSWISLCHSLLS